MKVYWSRCGHGHGNFGDKITPMLLKHFGVPVDWAPPEHAELIGVGSILEKVPEKFKGLIWTTGFMHESSYRRFAKARVLALRGRLTLDRVQGLDRDQVVLGDAGLLCDQLAPPARKKFKLGVIPHFVDIADPFVHALASTTNDICVIDICAEGHEVIRAVAECENIVSSSLHGLILADSLGIPNRWMELNRGAEPVTGSGFKFRDYSSTLHLDAAPLHVDGGTTLDDVLAGIDRSPRSNLEELKRSLCRTIAAIKGGIRPLSAAELERARAAAVEWQQRRAELKRIADDVIPRGSRVIVADDDQLGDAFRSVEAIPFTERNGVYWGPPATAEEAIAEIQRQIDCGARWLVIAWPMFWIFDQFLPMARYVENTFECCYKSEAAQVFKCKPSGGASEPSK